MSTNSSPPTRRSVLKTAAAGGALGLLTSASSSIVNSARAKGIAADSAIRFRMQVLVHWHGSLPWLRSRVGQLAASRRSF